jgi:catechol 2,3-dioxygenase-like lactoylglutathione lyase family enzyme
MMTRPTIQRTSPFFIVSNLDKTIAFYSDKLGFETRFREPDQNPFFAIFGRDGAQFFVKSHKDVLPLPNSKRHPSMRWDAFVYAADPEALPAEFADHGTVFSAAHVAVRIASLEAAQTVAYIVKCCSSNDQGSQAHQLLVLLNRATVESKSFWPFQPWPRSSLTARCA